MKDNSEREIRAKKKSESKIQTVEIEIDQVKYSKSRNLAIDFHNQIDAWSKMEFVFSKQISRLRLLETYGVQTEKCQTPKVQSSGDLKPLQYSVRDKLE
jgi:hypothetical protein